MKTTGGKKKAAKKDQEFIKDPNVITPPENLLPEQAADMVEPPKEKKEELMKEAKEEVGQESSQEPKEEVKKDPQQEIKEEIKSEVKLPESETKEVKPVVETVVQEVNPPAVEPAKVDKPEVDKKEDLPFIDNKPIDIKNDDVVVPASTGAAPPPIPPVAVQINRGNLEPADTESKGKKLLGLALLLVIVLVVGGTWFYFSNKSKKQAEQNKIVIFKPTGVIVSPSPTKVATAEVKLEDYQIEILNGSGISGEALRVKTILEDGRFEVSGTGNADDFNYTDTIIQAKKEVEKSFLDRLKSLLSKTYSIGKDENLEASESSEVVVIVGSKKAK